MRLIRRQFSVIVAAYREQQSPEAGLTLSTELGWYMYVRYSASLWLYAFVQS